MKNKVYKLAGAVITCVVVVACSKSEVSTPQLNSGTPSAGDADFSAFVSIGDSLTAGYADGALYLFGQLNSFPAILASQFAAVGGGAFTQPLLGDPTDPVAVEAANLGGLLVGGTPGLIQNRYALNTQTEAPERIDGTPTLDVVGTGLNGTAFNNMGVPGAKSFHLGLPGYGDATALGTTANPYFVRFSSALGTTVIADAAAQAPSFIALWIGNNDVLSYATSGGIGTDQTGNTNPLTYGSNDITDPGFFAATYNGLIGAIKLANPNVQGVLINVPDVSTIPFFTTVPYNAIPLDQATADLLNANPSYIAYNAGLQSAVGVSGFTQEEADARTINFIAGQNAPVIEDEGLTNLTGLGLPSIRQANANDLILLPVASYLGTEDMNAAGTTPAAGMPWGLGTPLEDIDVLVPSEIQAIDTARNAYNAAIKAAADGDANFVLFDAAATMAELKASGIDYGTGSINSDFATGGGFSLDGVHPTARGYAVVANSIIDVINTGFNANVYKVNPADYSTVLLK